MGFSGGKIRPLLLPHKRASETVPQFRIDGVTLQKEEMLPLPNRASTRFICLYFLALLCLLSIRPFWLDEILQLVGSRCGLRALLTGYASHSAGQSPLGPVLQFPFVKLLGISRFAARLPSALASVLSCLGLLRLCKSCGVEAPVWTLAAFACLPLQLRYATEARPYELGLCIAVWATALAVEIIHSARIPLRSCTLYTVLAAAGVYTQPYTLFVILAHVAYAAVTVRNQILRLAVPALVAALLYLPWYLNSRTYWRSEVNAAELHFHFQAKLPLVIAREISGAGYLGALVLVCAMVLATQGEKLRPHRGFWMTLALVPMVLAVAADASFDYFFAIRQVIFVLPALVVLATPSQMQLRSWHWRALSTLLFLTMAASDARLFAKQPENWERAADVLASGTEKGGCIMALPDDSIGYFELFRPAIANAKCPAQIPPATRTVYLAVSPYFRDANAEAAAVHALQEAGFRSEDAGLPTRPRVIEFTR